MTMGHVDIQADNGAVAQHAAKWLTQRAQTSPGRFAVCLSGGSTPKALYGLLASRPFVDEFPWDRTHIFFGDERFVGYDHPDSNYRMAREAMLDHVPLTSDQIHPFPTDGEPGAAAVRYEDTLKRFYGADALDSGRPLFDVTFLGLGEDGHTASLFPGVAALHEMEAWTAAVVGAKPEPRLTLTYPSLNSTRAAAFLVAGEGKRDILARAMAGDAALPAAKISPAGGLFWFVDKAASG